MHLPPVSAPQHQLAGLPSASDCNPNRRLALLFRRWQSLSVVNKVICRQCERLCRHSIGGLTGTVNDNSSGACRYEIVKGCRLDGRATTAGILETSLCSAFTLVPFLTPSSAASRRPSKHCHKRQRLPILLRLRWASPVEPAAARRHSQAQLSDRSPHYPTHTSHQHRSTSAMRSRGDLLPEHPKPLRRR